MTEEPTRMIRSNGEQIDDNSCDGIHCLLNEMLVILQSTPGFHEKLSYLVRDTLANWHDLTAANLLRRLIDGGLGKEFSFNESEWFVEDMGTSKVTVEELTQYACKRVLRKSRGGRLKHSELLNVQQLRQVLRAK